MVDPAEIIYLDSNATTEIDPAVVDAMLPYLTRFYANPSSGYEFAAQVRKAIDDARAQVAALLGCEPGEIVFTSGGTESINSALNSALRLDPARQHIVTTAVEHSATWKHCAHLAERGVPVTTVGVDGEGNLDLDELERAIRPDTVIITAMWANNETGVLFPVAEIAEMARRRRVLFHTDAVQAVGKIPISLGGGAISYLSISAHKLHGPKGVGAIYTNRRVAFRPSMFGGSHENDRRAGTENVAGIVALGKAAEIARATLETEATRARAWRDQFEKTLLAQVPGTQINGNREARLPNTSNLSFAGVESGAALLLLDQRGLCCSAGSACRTGSLQASHVLRAMGCDDARARSSLRFSFSRCNRESDALKGAQIVEQVVRKLRALSPQFQAGKTPALA